MMKTTQRLTILLLFVFALFYSCKKEDDPTPSNASFTANKTQVVVCLLYTSYRNDLAGTEVYSQQDINNISIDTDWQKVIFRTAPMANYELSSAGGNDKTRFFISGNYYNQEGILIGTDYKRCV